MIRINHMRAIRIILIVVGMLIFVYAGVVLVMTRSTDLFNYAGFVAGAVFIAAGVWVYKLKELLHMIPNPVIAIVIVLFLAVLVHFTMFEVKVINFAESTPRDDAEYIVVLGAKVTDGRPSLEFQKRIDAALDYALNHENVIIVCTGGQGSDEDLPESVVAYNYFLSNGIDESRLLREERSTSTHENLEFAAELIGENPSNVIIVSSAFHLYRANIIASKLGYTDVSFIGITGSGILMPHYYVREYVAYINELL